MSVCYLHPIHILFILNSDNIFMFCLNKLIIPYQLKYSYIFYQMSILDQKSQSHSKIDPIKKFYVKKLVPEAKIPVKAT